MSYNVLYPVQVFNSVSMATSSTSHAVEVINQDNIGIQLHWTGTPTGTFSVQVSSDYSQDYLGNIQNAGHWIALPLSPAITAAGSPDDAYIDLNQLSAMYVRVVYTAVSGSGTLTGYVVAKGV